MHFETAVSVNRVKADIFYQPVSCRPGMNFILRIMKLTAILLFAVCLTASARIDGQTVTLSVKEAPLKEVFKEIQKQTGLNVLIEETLLERAGKVTLQVKNMPVPDVLQLCLKNEPLNYTIEDGAIIVKQKSISDIGLPSSDINQPPPPIDIHGRIVDSTGAPIVGASIQIKGTKKGTSTDANGNYELKGVDENAVLVISAVNIETFEIRVNSRTDLGTVSARIKTVLGGEVLVEANTGYQKLKPNETTGSYVVIDKKKLDEQFSTNILKKLDGVTNGLLFLSNGKLSNDGSVAQLFTVRGLSTINGSTRPLIVLDDNIFTGSVDNINPNDVESITILKDAAATSIYGVGGANGVIVITTKKGQLNKKFSAQITSAISVTEKQDIYSVPRLSIGDYLEVEQKLFRAGYFDGIINSKWGVLTDGVKIMLNSRNGKISSSDSSIQINGLKSIDSREQYNKYFNSPAITQTYALSMSGGTKNIGWSLSGAYDRSESSQNAVSQKLNLSLSNTFKINEQLSVNVSSYYTNSKSVSGMPSFENLLIRNALYNSFVDREGIPLALGKTYNTNYTDTAGNGNLLDWNYYPLTDYQHDRSTITNDQLIGSINVNYRFSRAIQLTASYNYQKQQTESRRYSDIESFHTRDLINTFANLNATNPLDKFPIPVGGIIRLENYGISSQAARIQADFNKSWNNHRINGIIGGERRESLSKPAIINSIYGFTENPTTSLRVDYSRRFNHYVYGSQQVIPDAPSASSKRIDKFVSLYGNIAYSYKNRYSLFGSFRKDASNIFGLSTNDKWNPLWSSGLGWEISKEPFYNLQHIFSRLRFKFTYGYSGNLDNSRTALPIIDYSTNLDLNVVRAFIRQPNNPSLKWEKSRQYNFGLDFATAGSRITGSLEYYQKLGTDLYGQTWYDYTTFGLVPQITANVANLKTTGIDLNLNIKLMTAKNVQWSVGGFLNYNKDKTTKYNVPAAKDGTALIGGSGNKMVPVIGKPLFSLVAWKWE